MIRTLDARRLGVSTVADEVAAVVTGGGVVIFPTDTVYGIGCDPGRAASVERIFALKNRPRSKALALHLGSVDALLAFVRGNAAAEKLARAFLPGALTVIVERPRRVGAFVTAGLGSLGLRVPDHELCRAILLRCGPLAGTSANFSGEPAFVGNEGAAELPPADLLVDDGPTPLGVESTVVDVSGSTVRLVREGAIRVEMLERVVGPVVLPGGGLA